MFVQPAFVFLFAAFAGMGGADFFCVLPRPWGRESTQSEMPVCPARCAKICALDGPAGGRRRWPARTAAGRGRPALAAQPACLCSFMCPMLFRDVLPFPRMPGASRWDGRLRGGKKTAPLPGRRAPHLAARQAGFGGGASLCLALQGRELHGDGRAHPTLAFQRKLRADACGDVFDDGRPRPVPPGLFRAALSTR